MGGRFDKFIPVIQLDEITSAEEVALAQLVALANSPTGQFIRKEGGVFVNSTLAETIALAGLSDVAITAPAIGDLLIFNGTSYVNLPTSVSGYVLTAQGVGSLPAWTATGAGTVTTVSVVTANGVSASVANATTTPALTFTLGSITPSAVQISGLTASEIVITDASKNLASAAVATYPSLTELSYVKGVTSAIQTQINSKGAGTVTAVSVASANGFAGSSSGGATPALTLSTSITGVLKGNATAISAATAGSDYAVGSLGLAGGQTIAGSTLTLENLTLRANAADLTTGQVNVTSSKEATNTTTASVALAGGLAVAKRVYALDMTVTNTITGSVSGTAATVTGAAQASITSLGTLTTLTVDDITINGNTISSAGASTLAITPTAGQAITFDGTVTVDAGVVAGMTSLTMSGNIIMAANSITMTGSIAATGARVTKGWFTDIESTNEPTVGGVQTKLLLAGGTMTGSIVMSEDTRISLDRAALADGQYVGTTIEGTAGATLAFGDIIYFAVADSRWELADATAAATGVGMIGICVLAAAADASATRILLQGFINAATVFPALTVGAPVYLDDVAGDVSVAIPTGADTVIRVLGFAMTGDEMYWNPSQDVQITVA